jgi:hypothetical protein
VSLTAVTVIAWVPMFMSARLSEEVPARISSETAAQLTLVEQYDLSRRELEKLERGKVLTQVLESRDRHEVSVLGFTKVPASLEQFMSYAQRPERFAASDYVSEMGRLTRLDPTTDLGSLRVRDEDVKAVRSCVLGDCDLKLPAAAIQRVSQLDREGDGFSAAVSSVVLGWLKDYLGEYRSRGNSALVVYADRSERQPLAAALDYLLAGSTVMSQHAAGLHRYLATGVADSGLGMGEQFYWSVEEFGMRPLTTITQQIAYSPDASDLREAWVAQKLLYASHYVQASLKVARLVENTTGEVAPSAYLVYEQRLMFDGIVGGIKRALLKRHLRCYVHDRIEEMREGLERYGGSMTAERI